MVRVYILLIVLGFLSGCGLLQPRQESENSKIDHQIATRVQPGQEKPLLKEMGNNWLYGNGMGNTLVNVGTIAMFPPAAIYLVGNAIIDVAGYEPLYVTNLLDEDSKASWDETYGDITSGPGRLSAAIAGTEYRNKMLQKRKLQQYLVREEKIEDSVPVTNEYLSMEE